MGLLSSCCCCCSVRKGSFVSGCYTIVYFFAFAVLTGNMAYLEIRHWLNTKLTDSSLDGGSGGNDSSSNPGSLASSRKTSSPPVTPETSTYVEEYDDMSPDRLKYAPSQSPPLSIFVILLDFACELGGFFASIVLICGLLQERRALLIPWMVIVPAHTALDIYTSSDILVAFFQRDQQHHRRNVEVEQENWRTLILLTAVTITAVINIYALLCVYSQFQEYRAGRGTAAHERLFAQQQQQQIGAGDHGQQSSCSGRRHGPKQDMWYDESGSKSRNTSGNFGLTDIPLSKMSGRRVANPGEASSNSDNKIPTVRFENDTSSSSGDSADTRQKLLPGKSCCNSSRRSSLGNVTGCQSLVVPSSRGGYVTSTLLEEQSTTADSMDE